MPVVIFILILLGVIGAIVVHLIGSAEGSKARQRYTLMKLADLRAVPPATKLVVGVTQRTIYGNDRTAWFAALVERTLGDASTTEDDLAYLNQRYVELLRQLGEFLTATFPTCWSASEPDKPVVLVLNQADAYYSVVTDCSLRWLGEMAARQLALMTQTKRTMVRWDSSLFITKTDIIHPSAPLMPQKSVLETPCTLARLQQEIQRLGGQEPVTTAAGTSAAATAAPAIPPLTGAPPLVAAAGNTPHPAPAQPPAKFLSAWTIWAFIPWLMWLSWLHAGLRTRRPLHFCLGIPYLIPLVLLIAVSRPHENPPDWLLGLHAIFWFGGIIHVFVQRKSVNRGIAERLSRISPRAAATQSA